MNFIKEEVYKNTLEKLQCEINKLKSDLDKKLIPSEQINNNNTAVNIAVDRSIIKYVFKNIKFLTKLDNFINGEDKSKIILDLLFEQDSILICYLRSVFGVSEDILTDKFSVDKFRSSEFELTNILHNDSIVFDDDLVDTIVLEYISILKNHGYVVSSQVSTYNSHLELVKNEKVIYV